MEIEILALGAALFIAMHLVPALGSLRAALVDRLSLNGYKALFVIISWLGIGLMIWGKSHAPHTDVWLPPGWGHNAAMALMLPSMMLLTAAKLPTNIKRVTPHPMMWGFFLWSAAHLLANGDLASIILFGSLGAYSIVAIVSANRRGAKPSKKAVPVGTEAAVLGSGVAVYIAFLFLHPYLFGAALI